MKRVVISLLILFGLIIILYNALQVEKESEKATFAGGCFWRIEADFEKVPGVKEAISGYIGGTGENPTYENYRKKGYVEAVEVSYDPSKITYKELLDIFWENIYPADLREQFAGSGSRCKTTIFYYTEKQKHLAEESKTELEKSGRFKNPITTEILEASTFYKAEDYHQDYYNRYSNL